MLGLDFFFGLRQEREDLGHGEDFDLSEKLGWQMREPSGVEAAGADFGKEVGAQHFAAIDEIDRRGDMARVAMLRLDGCELRGEFGAENEREVFCGLVVHGLLYEGGECHGIAAARAVIRVDTRESRAARSRDSPIE